MNQKGHRARFGPVAALGELMKRLDTLRSFKDAYQAKHFPEDLFDCAHGYLQTSVENNDDRMPMQYFVDYNNIWWFELLHRVEVYHVSLDDKTGTGSIAFDVVYGDAKVQCLPAHGMQYVKFDEMDRISYIRTYANPLFWRDTPDPVVQFDAIGNEIWLGSGYDMVQAAADATRLVNGTSLREVGTFLDTLAPQIDRIRTNLGFYAAHGHTQWAAT